jgi:fatty-acyl-CoA synthase
MPDDKWGEVGCAVVVTKPGQTVTQDELIAFLRERLAKYKLPKTVIFVDALPRTAIGKLDKKVLVQRYGAPTT